MELLFSELPTEVIDIIVNFSRQINLLTYFESKHIGFDDFLRHVRRSDCILTVRFHDYDLESDYIDVYGKQIPDYIPGKPIMHSFIGLMSASARHDVNTIDDKYILCTQDIEIGDHRALMKIKIFIDKY